MVTASCPAPFCSFQCVRKESLLIKDVLHVPHAFDLSERLVTEKLSVSVETEPDPWVCGAHKTLRALYSPPCGLSQRLWDKPWAAKGI